MSYKNQDAFKKKRMEIIKRLNEEGIKVKSGKRIPVNGQYSGIIGRGEKVLRMNFPH
jgi:hypothetical protein